MSSYGSTRSIHVPFGTAYTLQNRKIPTREPSAVPVLSPGKFLIRRSSLWALPASPYTNTVKAETYNGATNLPDIKEFKQM